MDDWKSNACKRESEKMFEDEVKFWGWCIESERRE